MRLAGRRPRQGAQFSLPTAVSVAPLRLNGDASPPMAQLDPTSSGRWSPIVGPVMLRGGECLRLSRRQQLLSPHSSRPKKDHQNNRPDNTPADPCDVRVSCLPFENLLMDGHQECSVLTPALQIGPSSVFSILVFATSLSVSHMLRTGSRRWRDASIASING